MDGGGGGERADRLSHRKRFVAGNQNKAAGAGSLSSSAVAWNNKQRQSG